MNFELRSNGERSAIFWPPEAERLGDEFWQPCEHKRVEFYRLLATCEASTWIEAKLLLQGPDSLTTLQQRMMDGKASEREIVGRIVFDPFATWPKSAIYLPLHEREYPDSGELQRAWKEGYARKEQSHGEHSECRPAEE